MKNKVFNIIKQFFLHLIAWSLLYVVLYGLRGKNVFSQSLMYVFGTLTLASAISSYVHFILFKRFFTERKYKFYLLGLTANLLVVSLFYKFITEPFSPIDFLACLVSMVFVNVFSVAFYFSKNGITKQVQLQEIKNQQLEAELQLLKSQINPHFLFNTFNSLYGLITLGNNEQAAETTLKLSDLMRYVLDASQKDRVSLKKEVKFINDYIDLEKIRLNPKADVTFKVQGLENDILVAPLLFIPLVENVFKHGFQEVQQLGYAYFSLSVQGKQLFFEAENSVNATLKTQTKSGIGLVNLRKRLSLIYPDKHSLLIDNNEKTFKVILHIEL